VWVHTKEPHTYMELSLRSSLLWPKLVEELGEDVDLRQPGGLAPCLTEEDYAKAEARLERQRRSSLFQGKMIPPDEVFAMQPGITRDLVGASWSPHDGSVNWIKWTHALARGCERVGVRMFHGTTVQAIERDQDNCVTGVLTDHGRIAAPHVVCAAGPWSKGVAELVDLQIDFFPQKGQILITEATEMICPMTMDSVRQEPHGQFYMGTTHEDVGFDWSTTAEAYKAIREYAARLVPATKDLRVVRHFAGLRPMPRDGKPILGPVPHVPGFYMATSHSGITLSPIHGKIISDLIIEGETDVPIEDYDPLRFQRQGFDDTPDRPMPADPLVPRKL
ncbi:MAG: FAD-binding oxidoreductase, partial [Caldilineaceae bacterium]|nr:FAD-binding oxidoreductase [Caldilineaceae bacterium]